jgi:DNA polymerase III subunit tau-like protein
MDVKPATPPATPVAPAPAPTPAPAAASAAPSDRGPDIDLDRIRLGWEVLLEKVKKRRIAARAMLLPASPVAWRGGELVIEFGEKSRFHRDQMSDPSYQTPLSEAFHETFGVRPRIRCVLRESSGNPAASAPGPARIEDEIDDSEAEPESDSGAGEPGSTTRVQPVTTGHASAVDLVKQGFGAEIVEER